MATNESAKSSSESLSLSPKSGGKAITHYLPFLDWLVHYRRQNLVGDLLAGTIVAIMLVPQAYGLRACWPGYHRKSGCTPVFCLLIIYGLLGTSRTLASWPGGHRLAAGRLRCHSLWLSQAVPNMYNWL